MTPESLKLEKSLEDVQLTPELIERLRGMYEEYRPKTENSPYVGCYDMSVIISVGLGLKKVEGYFLRNDSSGISEEQFPHTWNEDSGGTIVDFTRHQFNRRLPPEDRISIENLPIFSPGEKGYERYIHKKEF